MTILTQKRALHWGGAGAAANRVNEQVPCHLAILAHMVSFLRLNYGIRVRLYAGCSFFIKVDEDRFLGTENLFAYRASRLSRCDYILLVISMPGIAESRRLSSLLDQ